MLMLAGARGRAERQRRQPVLALQGGRSRAESRGGRRRGRRAHGPTGDRAAEGCRRRRDETPVRRGGRGGARVSQGGTGVTRGADELQPRRPPRRPRFDLRGEGHARVPRRVRGQGGAPPRAARHGAGGNDALRAWPSCAWPSVSGPLARLRRGRGREDTRSQRARSLRGPTRGMAWSHAHATRRHAHPLAMPHAPCPMPHAPCPMHVDTRRSWRTR